MDIFNLLSGSFLTWEFRSGIKWETSNGLEKVDRYPILISDSAAVRVELFLAIVRIIWF